MPVTVDTANARPASGYQPSNMTGGAAILRPAVVACCQLAASVQDQIDCAELALALGETEVARLLFDLAFLRRGFSHSALGSWDAIAARTGLWTRDTPPPTARPTGDFALGVALEELRVLIAAHPISPALRGDADSDHIGAVQPQPRMLLLNNAVQERIVDALTTFGLVGRLCAALRQGDVSALAGALEQVRESLLDEPEQGTAIVGQTLLQLAAAAAAEQLRDFFRIHHMLCWGPFGEPALFLAAARAEEGALGPYFSGVGRLIRTPKDLFGLIALAAEEAAAGRRLRLERWLALLATHLDAQMSVALVDEIGDRGLIVALGGMLEAALRRHDKDIALFSAIRDAALDLGTPAIAARAQAAIARMSVNDVLAWVLLADALATEGSHDAARAAIAQVLKLSPVDQLAQQRVAALDAGQYEPFHLLMGLRSSSRQIALRARYRSNTHEEAAAL